METGPTALEVMVTVPHLGSVGGGDTGATVVVVSTAGFVAPILGFRQCHHSVRYRNRWAWFSLH